uniref:Uncharacterized protein n=1 Tax=Biomphalaria glabrata TaxID=6526 RepID=A0A2C9L4V2_BIOGL
MTHLPGAGKRYITEDFMVHLPTMTEIPNPNLPIRHMKRRAKPFDPLTGLKLPPSQTTTEDWTYVPRPRYPHFSLESCPMRRYCMGIAYNVPKSLARNICSPEDPDPRVLPYGLPRETFDVRRRANWFDYWKEDHCQYAGAYQNWENTFGAKYFYTDPLF